jgi:hypothetical protein
MEKVDMDKLTDIYKNINKARPVGRHGEAKSGVNFLPHITPSPEIPAAKKPAVIHASRLAIKTLLSFLVVGSMLAKAKYLSPLSTPSSRIPA